jgi:cytoplasmic iron level regulating protein YaaA (DUF328/UPF0246 family)
MIIVLSPAKTLDFESPAPTVVHSTPSFLDRSGELVKALRRVSPAGLGELMSISPALADLNSQRFKSWRLPFDSSNAKQAALAFAGDVYEGLDAPSLGESELIWAQDRVRILSGLYGLLRPLDLIQPYRLEMGTRLATRKGADLYHFWGDSLAKALAETLADHRHRVIINLASNEYFRALPQKALGFPVVQPVFEERRDDQWKVISFMAKRARGSMTRWAVQNRADEPQALQAFEGDGYRFTPDASDDFTWVFRRG